MWEAWRGGSWNVQKRNCRKGPRAEGQRSDLISLKQLIKSSLDLQNRRIIGVYLGGYSNNTERFGTFVKRGIIVIGNMVIQPPCPLSFGKKHAGPLDRLDPDR